LRRIQHFLLAFSFFWIGLWAIVGSLLAAKLNASLLHLNESWLVGIQRDLMRSAHAHMNLMAIVVSIVALSMPKLLRGESWIFVRNLALSFPASIAVFGAGIVGESFFPTSVKGISLFTIASAIGGTVFIFSCFSWAALFWQRRN
jgi:hypothetical protein